MKTLTRTSAALFAASSLFGLSAHAEPVAYEFDANHTTITWQAEHFGFSEPSGKFMDITGSLTLDETNPANSSVDVVIRPASVVTGIAKFDEHLKSADFFNIAQFPEASFKSTRVELDGDDKDEAKVHGTLTLLGVSKPVVLDVDLNKIGENPMNKKKTAGFSASTTIKRSDFGINYALPGVSDEVELEIEVEAAVAAAQ